MNNKVREVIVVEGQADSAAVKRALDAQTIETHGYGIRRETWEIMDAAYRDRGLLILTDPDFSGNQIRKKLTARFPQAKQAHIAAAEAGRQGEIGVEHAAPAVIQEAVMKAHVTMDVRGADTFSARDMRLAGLADGPSAADRRAAAGKILGIGGGNAKAFRKKLNGYGITPEELDEAIRACDDRGHQG